MNVHRTVGTAILLTIVCVGGSLPARGRVDDVLAEARRAIGIDGRTPIVRLSVDAIVTRGSNTRRPPLSSEASLRFAPPDKYLRIDTFFVGGISRTTAIALKGNDLLFEDGGTAAEIGADPRTPGPQRDEAIANLKRESFRLLTVWLLSPPADARCTFSSAGTAQAPGGRTDVVDVRGEDGRNVRLFLDPGTHRLLGATYDQEIVDPEQARTLSERTRARLKGGGSEVRLEDRKRLAMQLREELRKLPRKTITVQMRFSRHRAFDSVILPEIMVVEAGEMKEEWKIVSVKVNPPADPTLFGAEAYDGWGVAPCAPPGT